MTEQQIRQYQTKVPPTTPDSLGLDLLTTMRRIQAAPTDPEALRFLADLEPHVISHFFRLETEL